MPGPRRVLVEPFEPRRLLATVTVSSLADSGAGCGAIYQGDKPLVMARVIVTDCDGGSGGGGAIASSGVGATLELSDCTFTNNTAGGSGGAILDSGASASFLRCTFSNNAAVG